MSYSADVSIKRKCFKESNSKTVVMLHYPDIIISQGDIQQSSANYLQYLHLKTLRISSIFKTMYLAFW